MRDTVLTIFAVSLMLGGFRWKSCCRKMFGEFLRAPSALVAHMASMAACFSEKNFGTGSSSHATAA